MNAIKLLSIILIAAMLAASAGCKKTNPSVFTWNYDSTLYVADSASAAAGADNRIVAVAGTRAVAIDPGTRLAVGTYHLGATNTGSFLLYISVGQVYSQSGTITITSNDNTKMSGSFSSTLQDGTYISGSFTDMPIQVMQVFFPDHSLVYSDHTICFFMETRQS